MNDSKLANDTHTRQGTCVDRLEGNPFVTELMQSALAAGDPALSWGWRPAPTPSGMTRYEARIRPLERYAFDFRFCARSDGWQQFDTTQDAPYFGIWVHLAKRVVCKFIEGEVYIRVANDRATLKTYLEKLCAYHGDAPPAATVLDFDDDGELEQVTQVYDPHPTIDDA
jgi:hypothetical protein